MFRIFSSIHIQNFYRVWVCLFSDVLSWLKMVPWPQLVNVSFILYPTFALKFNVYDFVVFVKFFFFFWRQTSERCPQEVMIPVILASYLCCPSTLTPFQPSLFFFPPSSHWTCFSLWTFGSYLHIRAQALCPSLTHPGSARTRGQCCPLVSLEIYSNKYCAFDRLKADLCRPPDIQVSASLCSLSAFISWAGKCKLKEA